MYMLRTNIKWEETNNERIIVLDTFCFKYIYFGVYINNGEKNV